VEDQFPLPVAVMSAARPTGASNARDRKAKPVKIIFAFMAGLGWAVNIKLQS
jgi:hypothetical protein